MNVFEFAMQMEKDGEAFYREIAQKTKNAGLQKIFNTLADEEVVHYNTFKKLYENTPTEVVESNILDKAKNMRPVDIKHDHIFGNPDAPVTIIEYSDFECPFCKRFHPTMMKLMENNTDTVRWVYRHFPLAFHNPGAQKQAEATECVAELNGNDAFWDYSEKIYSRTKSNGKGFPIANLRPLAEEIGVDGDAFTACLNSGKMSVRVKVDIANGRQAGISSTPAAYIINQKGETRFIAGAAPLAKVQSLVDELAK